MKAKKKRKPGIYKGANKRAKILRAAEKEFARKGFAGARMKSIGKAAGLDKATLYHYFRTKQELYEAVLYEVSRSFSRLGERGIDRDTNPEEELTEFVSAIINFLNNHRSFALILRREFTETDPRNKGFINKALSPVISQVRDWINENIEKQELREVDLDHAIYTFFEILFGYFTLNREMSWLFFSGNPYNKEMLERRKAHITQLIRRFLVPEEMLKRKKCLK